MNKNNLISAFSNVCAHITDTIHDLLLPKLDDEMEMVTPIFKDAHIEDIQTWWDIDNHLARFIAYLTDIESNVEGGMQDNINAGIDELRAHPHLLAQLQAIHDASHTPTAEILKYIPHVAEYSNVLKATDGYKKLDTYLSQANNVIAWPIVTLGGNPTHLKSAFYLNVAILSADNTPLKPKIQSLPRPAL